MLESITATALAGQALEWSTNFEGIVILVGGLGVALLVANWTIRKLRGRAGGGKKRAAKRRKK